MHDRLGLGFRLRFLLLDGLFATVLGVHSAGNDRILCVQAIGDFDRIAGGIEWCGIEITSLEFSLSENVLRRF